MKKLIKWISLALAATSCAMFAACTPSSLEKAKEKMAKEGYEVFEISKYVPSILLPETCVGNMAAVEVEGLNILSADWLYACLFETANDAKAFVADWDEVIGKGTAIQDGKWVYAGSEDAIEDFTEGLF